MLKKAFIESFLLLVLFANNSFTFAQANEYGEGLLDEPDMEIFNAPIQVPMTENLYRSIGTVGSIKKYAPTPKSQATFGTCSAWATGYCARTILEAYRLGITDKAKIDAMAFSPIFIFRLTKGNETNPNKKCSGSNVGELCITMQAYGIPTLQDLPDLCLEKVSDIKEPIKQKAKPNTIAGFVQLWNHQNYQTKSLHEKVNAVKMSINNGKPVIISQYTTETFRKMPKTGLWAPLASERPGEYKGDHGRHAMCIVGYDDKILGGAFEIQNSWGENWGNGGYFWVSYKDMHNFVYAAIELQHMPEIKIKETVNLAGAFSLNQSDNTPMPAIVSDKIFKMKEPYTSGTRFRMYIDNNEPAYVYAFGADGTNKTFEIFPHLPNVSPLLDYKMSQVAIPSEKHTVRMDGTVGTDYFCVLYSKKALNIEDIRKKIEQQPKHLSFHQKLETVLGDKLINNPQISVDNKGFMRFKASSNTGAYIVPIITEMKHI